MITLAEKNFENTTEGVSRNKGGGRGVVEQKGAISLYFLFKKNIFIWNISIWKYNFYIIL